MPEEKKEYFLCPFGETSKPRLCPAKSMNAGWKCPMEKGDECALAKIVDALTIIKSGY